MKVYPDANVFITYLLGQKGEQTADRFFKQGIGCRFSIVASKVMFAEVAKRCGQDGIILLQKSIDGLQNAGKLEIVDYAPDEVEEAYAAVMKMSASIGRNDALHSILSKKYADILVTDDRDLARFASKAQKVMGLAEFVDSKPQPP